LVGGGGALLKGIEERLKIDLKAEFRVGTEISVRLFDNPVLDAWKGMRSFYGQHPAIVDSLSIKKLEYEENGYTSDLFKENPFSNKIN
jgi:actin-related protein